MVSLYSFYLFRRVDDSLEFYNNTWQEYKDGFNNGIDNGNLWLGNDRINVMSSQSDVTLRIEIFGNRYPNTDPNLHNNTNPNIYLYGKYNFSVNTILTKILMFKIS